MPVQGRLQSRGSIWGPGAGFLVSDIYHWLRRRIASYELAILIYGCSLQPVPSKTASEHQVGKPRCTREHNTGKDISLNARARTFSLYGRSESRELLWSTDVHYK